MVRRYYITGSNNVGDPAVGATTIVDPFFEGKDVTAVFKEGFRYYVPQTEWTVDVDTPDTVQILNGVQFDLNEVIVVEVSEKKNGETGRVIDCSNEVDPYLPDILKCVVARVNAYFENRDDDPFSVYYDHGIYEQVGSDKLRSDKPYLFIWLVMPFTEESPVDHSYFGDATCKLIIAIRTESNYTQIEREDISFHPRLLPVYKRLVEEIKNEPKLDNSDMKRPARRLLPYWGGGDMMGSGQPNLWKDNVDAIEIPSLKLKIGHLKCCTIFSNF